MTKAMQSLIATVLDCSSTNEDLQSAARSFIKAASEVPLQQRADALITLGKHLNLDDPSRAAVIALVCGALVELGCDPKPISGPLVDRLRSLLESSVELADACAARMPTDADKEEKRDPHEAFAAAREQEAVSMPRQNADWDALEQFWPATIAAFSVSPELRAEARSLRDLAAKVSAQHIAGHWLRFMLSVLDNEPILVLEPETRLGMLGRLFGVVDNFQLNVLLMDAFPRAGIFSPRRVPKTVVDIARGLGPQRTDESVSGVWNLYTWQALKPDGTLPDPKAPGKGEHWIWNEGVPEDIPLFENRRVVLLGPLSYPRGWLAQRLFNKLPARLECESVLKKREVEDWLSRLAAAASPKAPG